jgi:hypothetical protein
MTITSYGRVRREWRSNGPFDMRILNLTIRR